MEVKKFKLQVNLITGQVNLSFFPSFPNKIQVTHMTHLTVSVDMNQDTENINCHVIYIPMDLTEKDIEFKFIVDGEWKYAIDLPHRTDSRKCSLLVDVLCNND
jgi:hypothetical protein